jgi:site-specific DNA recombinase
MRVAIYARYSSKLQRGESIGDQSQVCRRYIQTKGWTLVQTYTDAAISGASRQRPGFLKLIRDAEQRKFDVVVCEAVDRLGRRLADTADLHDRLAFLGIQLHATSLGEITHIHVAIMGMMAQHTLKDLGEKTKRGQLGRILKGKAAGGLGYGYRVRLDGEPGERTIVEHEADIVRRSLREFADGKSPEAIARDLNREGILGPRGRPWSNTTIRGQAARGTGLLNNELYRGVLVWNRCAYVKDPLSGKRVARPNPSDKYDAVEVPHLRIVDDDLWTRVKARQASIRQELRVGQSSSAAERRNLNASHRPRFLLSGLLQCASCGGGYTVVAKDRYGCATRRQKGICENARTITRTELEGRVFDGLKHRLLAPDLIKEFVHEFHEEVERNRATEKARLAAQGRRLADVERKISSMLKAIEDGMYHPTMKERMIVLEAERAVLLAETEPSEPTRVEILMHPNLPDLYRRKVSELERLLEDGAERHEAQALVRSMIDKVVLKPRQTAGGLDAVLHGELAAVLAVCSVATGATTRAPGATSQLSVVAGACFRLNHNWGVFRRALHLGLRPLVAEARKCAQATSGHAHEELAAEPEFGQTTVATPVVCLRSDGSHCKPLACPAGVSHF